MKRRPCTIAMTDDLLFARVGGTYLEMPGLRLTIQQAQRLLGLDEFTCRRVLDALVDAGFLCRADREPYARVAERHR